MFDKTDTAVLFVHGILGTPEHFRCFMPVIPQGWTVQNITLQGHCGTAKDFSKASMTQWKQQVHAALEELRATHERIFIVAHSMGTLFALQEAVPIPVDALFLLNVPLKIRVTPQLIKMCWKVFWGKIGGDDPRALAARDAYSIAPDKNVFHYVGWIPRYLELFSEIRKTAKQIGNIQVPCYVYLSADDEMVSPKTRNLLQDHTKVVVKMLKESGHFYYAPKDKALLLRDFREIIGK